MSAPIRGSGGVAMAGKAWVWGYDGIEFFEKGHVAFKIAFAVADQPKKRLAWYLFTQDISGQSKYDQQIQRDFAAAAADRAGITERRVRFGSLAPIESLAEISVPF